MAWIDSPATILVTSVVDLEDPKPRLSLNGKAKLLAEEIKTGNLASRKTARQWVRGEDKYLRGLYREAHVRGRE